MPILTIAAIVQWIGLAQQVFNGGSTLWYSIKGVLAAHGVEADTSELDRVIEDAERRKAIAAAEAAK